MKARPIRFHALFVALVMMLAAPAAVAEAPTSATHAPKDTPYPGMLSVNVDLSDAAKRIFRVHETIPVSAGAFTLFYPQWIPGEHAPSGPIGNVAGLIITANGKKVPWTRDLRDMFALHVDVPQGVTELQLEFQFLSPGSGGQFGDSVSATASLVDMEFNQVAFYPAGYYSRQVQIQPTVTLPAGWKFASALQVESHAGDVIHFKPVSFNHFVDSPLIAGEYFKHVDLDPGAKVPVRLNIVGDSADDVDISDDQIKQHRQLVQQAYKLFGTHHYAHYDFLLTLSDHTGHFGLEHHQSSDDRLMADFLTDDSTYTRVASLLPHEYVHSWNGKFRRPADLWTPNFNMVKQDDLLWVYEGLTDYWAGVLTARSGLWTAQDYRDSMASIAASMAHRTGRSWRSLQDTASAVPLSGYASGWRNYRRGTDYYPEGQLLWLDVDTEIRTLSHNRRSLDDFAKAFYGMDPGSFVTKTYTFDDLVNTLNTVQPYDWAAFLRQRLDYTGAELPENGLERGGWKLVYTDKPSDYDKGSSKLGRGLNLAYSMGFSASSDGKVFDVQWDGPAFRAGLVPGEQIVAVNGKDYSESALKQAIKDAADSTAPIALLIKNIDLYSTLKVDYHGGMKYPHLERIKGARDLLDDIVAKRK